MKQAILGFVNKITGKEPISQEGKLKFLTISCLVVHVALIELFILFNCFVLVCYNLCVVAFYMYEVTLVKKKKLFLGYCLMYIEVIVTVILGTIFVGWDSGFYLYLWAIAPAGFYMILTIDKLKKKFAFPFALGLVCMSFAIGLYIYSQNVPPTFLEAMDVEKAYPTFYIFNIVIACLFLTSLAHLFILEVVGVSDVMMAQNQNLEHTASVDPLTALYNRRHMESMLEAAMEQAKQRGTLFSLIMGDIDNFKRINDTYGHECGDKALLHVAEVMHRCVREGDAVCRWGGEEFLLLIRGNQETAVTVAERIRSGIEKECIEYQGQSIYFTITFGVTTYVPGYRMETLIRQADDHLYIGKTTGKNKVVV